MDNFKEGDFVKFLPEFSNGEVEFTYILLESPDGGRVKVMPLNTGLEFPPIQVAKIEWLIRAE